MRDMNTNVRDKEGNHITDETEQKERWKEHFESVLNRDPPEEIPSLANQDVEDMDINMDEISIAEIRNAINKLKAWESPGIDGILAELLKCDKEIIARCSKIWNTEKIPVVWKKGVIEKLPKKDDLSVCGNWRGIINTREDFILHSTG